VAFVGSVTPSTPVAEAAEGIRAALHFDLAERSGLLSSALRYLVGQAEELGVLVMTSGIVGSDLDRRLDPVEFRGFFMADPLAPLVFVNTSASAADQVFTLVREIARVAIGESGLDDADAWTEPDDEIECWCSQVAIEMLISLGWLSEALSPDVPVLVQLPALALRLGVDIPTVLRRLSDAGRLGRDEVVRLAASFRRPLPPRSVVPGEQSVRISERFARAVTLSTLEGQTLYRDAFRMLWLRRMSDFQDLAMRLGVTEPLHRAQVPPTLNNMTTKKVGEK